jgi:mono/diheme cytochrome c family protein
MLRIQKKSLMLFVLFAMSGLCGCGEKETNEPSVKLTASVVESGAPSTAVTTHSHSVTIPFSDPGSASQVNYTSTITNGHSHKIALSSQQFLDLKAGMRLIVQSTAAADGHTHTWSILGGSYLYESICYNCHSNDQRGSRGMSDKPQTSAQRDALQNPTGAPLSTATPADPNVDPTPPVTLDGAALYAQNCRSCHGPLASTTISARTAAAISTAIAGSSNMTSVKGLSAEVIQAIASVLP